MQGKFENSQKVRKASLQSLSTFLVLPFPSFPPPPPYFHIRKKDMKKQCIATVLETSLDFLELKYKAYLLFLF